MGYVRGWVGTYILSANLGKARNILSMTNNDAAAKPNLTKPTKMNFKP
jgi:hypothetical protein